MIFGICLILFLHLDCNRQTERCSNNNKTGEARVGLFKNNNHIKNYDDDELSILSKKQKDLRIRIQNTKNTYQKSTLKTERNKILHNIRERQIILKNEEMDTKIEGIDTSKMTTLCLRQQGFSTKRHLKILRWKIRKEI